MKARVAVLLSGRGSNYGALQDAVDAGELPAEIVLVVSNRESAAGLERARRGGVAARAIPHHGLPSRRAHEERILVALAEARVDWICLAGYMRLLSSSFVEHYPNRILNIHPSLLPSFPGLDAQRQALDHGVRVTGCTVHLVDAELDNGPIVVQRAVQILDDDDEASLSERVLEQEHLAYPEALRRVLSTAWSLQGRRLRFAP